MADGYILKVKTNNGTWIEIPAIKGHDGVDAVGINSAYVDNNGHLIIVLSNGTTIDAGLVATGSYDLPIASSDTLGGIKVGAGLSINSTTGTLSVTGGGTADAVEWDNVLDKPSTIAGYGITDATITDGTIILGEHALTPLTGGSNEASAVVITPVTTSIYPMSTSGSAGSAASFTQGTDTFIQNKPTTIDTTKFIGGSYTQGTFTAPSFTQGTDSFTQNKPTTIDITKFNGGSFTQGSFSGGSFSQGADSFTPPELTFSTSALSESNANGSIYRLYMTFSSGSFSQGADSFTAATHSSDSFTSANLSTGFYSVGTSASFLQGSDTFSAGSHTSDSFTPASFSSGFYSVGTSASFSQGVDSFTTNVPTAVTLPTQGSSVSVWTGYTSGVSYTYAEAQVFTGT